MKGRTIIFSIHQPRYSIYRLIDGLMLLSMGETIYHGPCEESLTFFKNIGREASYVAAMWLPSGLSNLDPRMSPRYSINKEIIARKNS